MDLSPSWNIHYIYGILSKHYGAAGPDTSIPSAEFKVPAAAESCISPMNSIAKPVVFDSTITAPQKENIVASRKPSPRPIFGSALVMLLDVVVEVAIGSMRMCPCEKLVVPVMKFPVGMVVELTEL